MSIGVLGHLGPRVSGGRQRVQSPRVLCRPVLLADLAIFAACAGAILLAGTRLVRHADHLALQTGLGGTRVGILLLATATSIPEIVSAFTAASLALPNLATGNLLGTLPLNLSALAIAELVARRPGVVASAYASHPRMLWGGFLTTAMVGGLLAAGGRVPVVAGIGLGAPLLLLGYAYVAWRPGRAEPLQPGTAAVPSGLGRSAAGFAAMALIVAGAALLLPRTAASIADETGIARAVVGTVLLAVATTLPELAVAVAAVRLGSRDLAVGNAFGSLLFNLALLGAIDAAFAGGSVLAHADAAHGVTVLGALGMFMALRVMPRSTDSFVPAATLLVLHAMLLGALYLVA